jgi:hypothetical protein
LTPIQYCPSKKFGEVLVDVIADYNEFSLMFIYQPDFVKKSSTPHEVVDSARFRHWHVLVVSGPRVRHKTCGVESVARPEANQNITIKLLE